MTNPTRDIGDGPLKMLMETWQQMVDDLTPILGEKDARDTADALLRHAIKSAKKRLNITSH